MRIVDENDAEVARGEVGEIVIRGHNIMKGYWDAPGRDRRGDPRRLVPQRRPRPRRRGRLLLRRRPQEGHDHPRRLQRLPARGRGAALRAPGDPRSGGARRPPPRVGRGGRRRGRPRTGRGAGAGGDQRLGPRADRRLQVPPRRLVPGRAAEGPDRQDREARDRGPGAGQLTNSASHSVRNGSITR